MELNIPAIEGIGGSYLYLVDRYGAREIYDVDFVAIPGAVEREAAGGAGLTYIDHLTHNVQRGNMKTWADFYERVYKSAVDPGAKEVVVVDTPTVICPVVLDCS